MYENIFKHMIYLILFLKFKVDKGSAFFPSTNLVSRNGLQN